jgi:chemotaxis protein MotA
MRKLEFTNKTIVIIASVIVGLALVGIVTGHRSFLSLEGLVIVIGGSVANAFLSYSREDVRTAFETIRAMLNRHKPTPNKLDKDIMQLILWAYVVQARDYMGLEKETANEKDLFVRYGLDLVVTSYSALQIREMMHTVADAEYERGCAPVAVLRNMAATAPAFGMVGTLIGMVILLQNVGVDIANIGGGLGIAMLSTLYGLLIARLICLPAAEKLLKKEERVRFRHYMLSEGLAMLAEKQTPFYMQDKLNSFLEPSKHFVLDNLKHLALHRQFAVAA